MADAWDDSDDDWDNSDDDEIPAEDSGRRNKSLSLIHGHGHNHVYDFCVAIRRVFRQTKSHLPDGSNEISRTHLSWYNKMLHTGLTESNK